MANSSLIIQEEVTPKQYGNIKKITMGRAEGRKEGIIANARKMKSNGFTLEMIADITGLTIEEVRNL